MHLGKHGYVPRVLFASGDNVMAKKVTRNPEFWTMHPILCPANFPET